MSTILQTLFVIFEKQNNPSLTLLCSQFYMIDFLTDFLNFTILIINHQVTLLLFMWYYAINDNLSKYGLDLVSTVKNSSISQPNTSLLLQQTFTEVT